MRKIIGNIYLAGCFFLPVNVSAQNEAFQKEYDEFRRQARTEYDDFRMKANKDYAEYMRKAWEWYVKAEPMPLPKDDMKPPVEYNPTPMQPVEERPSSTLPENDGDGKSLPYEEVVTVTEPERQPQPKPMTPIREREEECVMVSFSFYGTDAQVRMPRGKALRIEGKGGKAYAAAWEYLSDGAYDNLIRDCLTLRMKHQLCDWAYLTMLGELCSAVCGKGSNETVLMQAFLLCQSGYKIRLAYTEEGELLLLFKSEHLIYNLDGFSLEDGMFYSLRSLPDGMGLYICDVSFPEERPLSLWITQEQRLTERLTEERRLTSRDGKVSVAVRGDKSLLEFCAGYPTSKFGDDMMTRWAMYANTPLSGNVRTSLYPQLREVVKGLDAVAAAERLLRWVQTAFEYKYDEEVWGRDRAFFAEESLYYPYCDCEDRSILFSRLMRDLLGLDVLLVFYPGHLATAVEFKDGAHGDYIEMGGRRFTVCDPTYIGAPVGDTMPDMDNGTAKVILLNTK
ncbi:MAG: hypothetical protein IJ199_00875 [Prevotella sp.]|nr:hypothetical protein [Prevotella sp.]